MFRNVIFGLMAFTMTACGGSTEPEATPEPTPTKAPVLSPDFAFFSDTPVVARGLSGEWDSKYINPGAVVFHDGQFHMFRNGFTTWPGFVAVGYAVSDDGVNWTAVQDEPVFTSEQVSYANSAVLVTSVVVQEDGTWVFYFSTHNSASTPSEIGRATAASPTDEWQVDAEPVLSPGPDGAWDAVNVRWPNVVESDDGYVMFYGGAGPDGNFRIGRAESADGVTWIKYDDTRTGEGMFAESDPVLEASGEWDVRDADRPVVQLTPDGYVMIYTGGIISRRGIAVSKDGIHWGLFDGNPIISDQDFPVPGNTWDTALVYANGTYYYFMEIGTLDGTDIYLTIHEGPLW
ncbi:MAG: hypothetical protein OEV06_03295 [Anaerolineae bacterium]|nr:hypothetical protein [Anaerolineae bacterium]